MTEQCRRIRTGSNIRQEQKGAQSDLLLDHADKRINVCEIKYCADEHVIDKADAEFAIFGQKDT